MTPLEAKAILEAGDTRAARHNILVRTRSGAEYLVNIDCIEVGSDDWTSPDAYVYGTRTNGRIHMRGRRRVDTRDQTRWFDLSNVTHVPGPIDF
jgi:hypothetical protein